MLLPRKTSPSINGRHFRGSESSENRPVYYITRFGTLYIQLPEKRYYSIGEVARAFQVTTSLIRFWEKEVDVLQPKKNAKGNRKFTPEDIKNLQLIYHLVKERGFTLEGAKIHLKEEKHKTLSNFEIIRKLENIKTVLLKIKDQ